MEIIGYICYVLAAIDFIAGNFLGIDFTGVFWSPIALAILGSILVNAGSSDEQDENTKDAITAKATNLIFLIFLIFLNFKY